MSRLVRRTGALVTIRMVQLEGAAEVLSLPLVEHTTVDRAVDGTVVELPREFSDVLTEGSERRLRIFPDVGVANVLRHVVVAEESLRVVHN